MEDGLEYLVGERIGEVLNEAKSRSKRHYKEEEKYLEKLEGEARETVDAFLEDLLDWFYEDLRTAYCAGIEDGVRIARRILTV